MFDHFQPQGLEHTRLLCPPLSPEVAQIHVQQVSGNHITDTKTADHILTWASKKEAWRGYASSHHISEEPSLKAGF